MSARLHRLWHDQGGLCCYCDGPTYLASVETKNQARKRLNIELGVGSGKLLNQHVATLDRHAGKMACKFCSCQRGVRGADSHRAAMLAKVALEIQPVNRLVEDYQHGRLSWRTLSGKSAQDAG